MTIGLAILYGVAVMTAAFAAVFCVAGFMGAFFSSDCAGDRGVAAVLCFTSGSLFLSITFWLLGV